MRKSNIIVEENSKDENVGNLTYELLFDVMLIIFLFIIISIYTYIY